MTGLTRCPVTLLTMALCIAVYIRQNQDYTLTDQYACSYYAVRNKQYYRLITASFLHGSPWHLLMNLYSLYYLGTALERSLGSVWFALILFGGAAAGNLLCYARRVPSAIGLSGGLYALMFFYLTYVIRRSPTSVLMIIRNNIPNILINFLPGIAWQAHLGGGAFGIVMALIRMFL